MNPWKFSEAITEVSRKKQQLFENDYTKPVLQSNTSIQHTPFFSPTHPGQGQRVINVRYRRHFRREASSHYTSPTQTRY